MLRPQGAAPFSAANARVFPEARTRSYRCSNTFDGETLAQVCSATSFSDCSLNLIRDGSDDLYSVNRSYGRSCHGNLAGWRYRFGACCLNCAGACPTQRLKARLKVLCSEKPVRKAISAMELRLSRRSS